MSMPDGDMYSESRTVRRRRILLPCILIFQGRWEMGDGRPSKITVENWKIAFLRIDRVKILRKHERWIIPQLSVLDFPINPFSNLLFADRRTCRCPNQISWTDYIRMDGLNESIRYVFLLLLPRMRLWIWDLSMKITLNDLIRWFLL